jgi:hypothetical protein
MGRTFLLTVMGWCIWGLEKEITPFSKPFFIKALAFF